MYVDLLPLGSVVEVNGIEESCLICGRVVADENGELYDYLAMPYPLGMSGDDTGIFFNQDAITAVEFIGCQNAAEVAFKEEILSKLDEAKEIKVVDGTIVAE